MIDEKRLLEVLEKNFCGIGGVEVLKQIINEQPKVGEWIPCNSFLPPRETICLVTLKLAKEMNASIVKFGFLTKNKEWMILCDIGWEKVNSAYVLACMPLPEPFKGETEC